MGFTNYSSDESLTGVTVCFFNSDEDLDYHDVDTVTIDGDVITINHNYGRGVTLYSLSNIKNLDLFFS